MLANDGEWNVGEMMASGMLANDGEWNVGDGEWNVGK